MAGGRKTAELEIPRGTRGKVAKARAAYTWQFKEMELGVVYPAGDGLVVSAEGRMTIQFQIDTKGVVTGVEERWVRRRQTIPRKS